jgi:hypothetical protein
VTDSEESVADSGDHSGSELRAVAVMKDKMVEVNGLHWTLVATRAVNILNSSITVLQ